MKQQKILLGLLAFNGLSAVAGGIGLMTGSVNPGQELLTNTDFSSFYFPGVILFAVVGGSSLLAALAVYKKVVGAELASLLAGIILLFWLIGEVASIHQIHFLQVVYAISAIGVLYLSKEVKSTKR